MPANSSIQQLFAKYIKDETSIEETTLLFGLIADKEYDAEVASLLDAEIEDTAFADEYDSSWETTLYKIKSQLAESPVPSVKKRNVPLWIRLAGVAAMIVVAFGLYVLTERETKPDYTHLTANDIAPGNTGATLTLANGKKISLRSADKGEIAKEPGLLISKTADGQVIYQVQAGQNNSKGQNTLTTAIGETYIITLPDQTKVWLNAASSLTYHPALTVNGLRKVKLSGEGYFEVAKDKDHPFIVESGTQSIAVLGTHFNVNAYPDESVLRTTLLEGSVKVEDHGQTKLLKPGTQAANRGGHINLSAVDTEFAVAWKSNNFVFDRLDIKEIMKIIARWYNVEIIYKEEIPARIFWGSVSRFDNISKVLIPLEATGNVHFKIEGRKIYVSR